MEGKRIATEQVVAGYKESEVSESDDKYPKSDTMVIKNPKKVFEQEKHSYEEVVIGKRVVIPRFYNEVYERKVDYYNSYMIFRDCLVLLKTLLT